MVCWNFKIFFSKSLVQ